MHRGYTIRWRKRWDKGYHKDPLLWVMMDWFIDHAAWEDKEVFLKDVGIVKLKRGEVIFGINQLASFIGTSPKRIRTRLSLLEKSNKDGGLEFLARKRASKYSIGFVINYKTYQDKENLKGNQKGKVGASKGQGEGKVGATNNTYNTLSKELIIHLNKISGRRFSPESNMDYIIPRLKEGFTREQCVQVIEKKWLDPDFNRKYFCPETLFRKSKFEKYLNEDINTGGAPCNNQGKALTTEQIAEQQWKNRKRK